MIIATSILLISLLGLTGLIAFKWWELKSERFIFSGVRTRVGAHSHRLLESLRAEFPKTASRATRIAGRIVRAYASFGLAKLLVAFEAMLERVLRTIRTAPRELERRGEASPFLREVAAYKRMITRAARKEEELAAQTAAASIDAEAK
jgi:hypothetical protein